MAKFVIEFMKRTSLAEAIPVLSRAFCQRGTLVSHLKLEEGLFAARLAKIAPAMVDQGFSFIGRRTDTGRVVSAVLMFRKDLVFEDDSSYPAMKPLLELHKKIKWPDVVLEEPPSVLYGYLGGSLLPEEGGLRGTQTAIVGLGMREAKVRGLKYCVSLQTSEITQNMVIGRIADEFKASDSGIPEFADCHQKVVLQFIDLKNFTLESIDAYIQKALNKQRPH